MGLGSKLSRLLRVVATLIIIAILVAGCHKDQSQTGIWTKFSDMKLPPDIELENPWTVGGTFETYFVYRGILTIQTGGTASGVLTHPEERFDNAVGSTAEIKMKLIEGPMTHHDASLFHLHDGTRGGKICFFEDRIEIFDGNTLKATQYMDTTDGFHSYRLAVFKDSLSVYIDGESVFSVTLVNRVTEKTLMFGDGSERQGENINAQIEYLAYSVEGARSPLASTE